MSAISTPQTLPPHPKTKSSATINTTSLSNISQVKTNPTSSLNSSSRKKKLIANGSYTSNSLQTRRSTSSILSTQGINQQRRRMSNTSHSLSNTSIPVIQHRNSSASSSAAALKAFHNSTLESEQFLIRPLQQHMNEKKTSSLKSRSSPSVLTKHSISSLKSDPIGNKISISDDPSRSLNKNSPDLKKQVPINVAKLYKGAEKSAENRIKTRLSPSKPYQLSNNSQNTIVQKKKKNIKDSSNRFPNPTSKSTENFFADFNDIQNSNSKLSSRASSRLSSLSANTTPNSLPRPRTNSALRESSVSSDISTSRRGSGFSTPNKKHQQLLKKVKSANSSTRTSSSLSPTSSLSIHSSHLSSISNTTVSNINSAKNTGHFAHSAASAVSHGTSISEYEREHIEAQKQRQEYIKQLTSKEVMNTARANVDKKLRNLDKSLSYGNGSNNINLFGNERYNQAAIARAQELYNKQYVEPNRQKIDIGSGLFLTQQEIDGIAERMLSPVLNEVSARAEEQRANDLDIYERVIKNSQGFQNFKNIQIEKTYNDNKLLNDYEEKHRNEVNNSKQLADGKLNKLIHLKENKLKFKNQELLDIRRQFEDNKVNCRLKITNQKKRMDKDFDDIRSETEKDLISLQKEQDIMIVNLKTQLEICEKKEKELDNERQEIDTHITLVNESIQAHRSEIEGFDSQIHNVTVELIELTNKANNEFSEEFTENEQEILEDKLTILEAQKVKSKAALLYESTQLKQLETDTIVNARNIQINSNEMNFKREQLHSIRDIQNEIDLYSTDEGDDEGDEDILIDATTTRADAIAAGEVYDRKRSQYIQSRLEVPPAVAAPDVSSESNLPTISVEANYNISEDISNKSRVTSNNNASTNNNSTLSNQAASYDSKMNNQTKRRSWARFLFGSERSVNDESMTSPKPIEPVGITPNSNSAKIESPQHDRFDVSDEFDDDLGDAFSGFSQGTLPDVNNEDVEDEDDLEESMGRENSYFKEIF